MPTIVKTSKEADLRSLLGGFGNHLARWERLQAKWPAESRLILAYPNRILAQASIEWLVENVEGLRPVASYSGDERVQLEQDFLRVRGELAAFLGADQLDEKLLPKFGIGVNTWASVLSGVREGRPVFVVAEWGCGSADVDPAGPIQDITVPTRTSRNEATLAVVSGGVPFGPTRWKISAHDESPRLVEVGPDGRVSLGEMAEGQKVVVEQEGLVYDVKNRQFFEMGSGPTVFKVEAHRQARVVVLHPKAVDRSDAMDDLQIDVGGQIRDFELRPDGRTEDGPYHPGGPWKLKGESGEVLAECILKDGENIIDLMPEEVDSIPPEVDGMEEPVDDAPVPELTRFRLENGLRMAMRNQPFRLDFDGQAPSLQLETGDEGHVDAVWPDGVSKAMAITTIRDIERSIPLEHEPGTDQHTLRFGRRIPRWVWWTLAAIIALVFLMLLRVPYHPEIRIVDAETEAPIPGATVFYANLEDDVELMATADTGGIVTLNMGNRPLYQKIFQLNPKVPLGADADGYRPEKSRLDLLTWYWIQNWRLTPLREEESPEAMSCPDRVLVFQVCNENAVADDEFDVLINGQSIGRLDLTHDRAVSSIFVESASAVEILDVDFDCPLELASVFYFDPGIVLKGGNSIELLNVKNNKTGNRGSIGVRNYEVSERGIFNPCSIKNIPFEGESGSNFELKFFYADCCPGDLIES